MFNPFSKPTKLISLGRTILNYIHVSKYEQINTTNMLTGKLLMQIAQKSIMCILEKSARLITKKSIMNIQLNMFQ